jgi:hypothetical protein
MRDDLAAASLHLGVEIDDIGAIVGALLALGGVKLVVPATLERRDLGDMLGHEPLDKERRRTRPSLAARNQRLHFGRLPLVKRGERIQLALLQLGQCGRVRLLQLTHFARGVRHATDVLVGVDEARSQRASSSEERRRCPRSRPSATLSAVEAFVFSEAPCGACAPARAPAQALCESDAERSSSTASRRRTGGSESAMECSVDSADEGRRAGTQARCSCAQKVPHQLAVVGVRVERHVHGGLLCAHVEFQLDVADLQ